MAHGRARPLVMCRNWAIRSGRYQPTHSSLALGRLLQWQDDPANGDISAIRVGLRPNRCRPLDQGTASPELHEVGGPAMRSVDRKGASNRAKADFGIARRGCVTQNLS